MALLSLFLLTSLLSHIGHSAYIDMGIVDGTKVKAHSRPYMVSIQVNGIHSCGGFLVSANFVMTAAHCWNEGVKLSVVMGTDDLKKGKVKVKVKLYHIHPSYDSKNQLNDIMLLQLIKPVDKSKHTTWITIPEKRNHDVKAKQKCSIAGWGKISEHSGSSAELMEVNVTVMDTKSCKKAWKEPFDVSSLLCTSGHGGFCQGDSGGHLVCKNIAVGIVSFHSNNDCKSSKLPYVYTKISTFLPWIHSIIGNME